MTINPVIEITRDVQVVNSKDNFRVDFMAAIPRTVPNTMPNTVGIGGWTVCTIPTMVENHQKREAWVSDQVSDADIQAMVIDVMIPDYQRMTEEERWEENFALLF